MKLKTFKEILNECNSKPLFEQVLREAEQKPDIFGVYEDDKLISNGGPSSNEEVYKRFKNAPAHGSKNPTMSRTNTETNDPYYKADPELRTKDDQNIYYNSVKEIEPEMIDKAENIFMRNIAQRMRSSLDPKDLIAFYQQEDPSILDKISNYLFSIIKNNQKANK